MPGSGSAGLEVREQVGVVGLGERGALPSAPDQGGHLFGRRVGAVRVPDAAPDQGPDAQAPRLGGGERLDLAAAHAHLHVAAALGVRLDLLAPSGLGDRARTQVGQVRRSVPPHVISAMRSVGLPFETGAPCPSLPHMPSRTSKSAATASIPRGSAGRCRSGWRRAPAW